MNAPRLALLALCAVASTARADMTATSLQGWTRQEAYLLADKDRLIRGGDYKEGVVYCDFRTPPGSFPSRASMMFPTYPCVVLGWAPKGAPAKAGGLLATGRAYLKQGTGPQVSMPGSDTRTLVLDIGRVPYVPVTVMLLAPRSTPAQNYESYVAGGTDLTQPDPAKAPAARPNAPQTGTGGNGTRERTGPGTNTPSSMLERSSPGGQWYVFESIPLKGSAAAPSMGDVYCHIGSLAGSNPADYIKRNAETRFECVTLKAPIPAVKDGLLKAQIDMDGRAKFNHPNNVVNAALATLTWDPPGADNARTLRKGRPLNVVHAGAVNFFPTKRPVESVTPAESAAVALSDKEKLWLTKDQREAFKAPEKAADARKEIVKNLEPNSTAISQYNAALGKTPIVSDDLDKALPAEVWGKGNKAVVAESGPNEEIQLSKAELDKLKGDAYKADYNKYSQVNKTWRGNDTTDEVGAFNEARYDPIALHNATMAARKALGGASTPSAPTYAKTPLTADERKLLTPEELQKYERQEKLAKEANASQQTKDAFAQMSADMRKLIADEKRKAGDPAYPPAAYASNLRGIPQAEFEKLPEWQKNKLCNDPNFTNGATPGASGGSGTGAFNGSGSGNGRSDLTTANAESQAALNQNGGGGNTTTTTSWIQTACGPRRVTNTVTTPANGGGTGNVAGSVPPLGKDSEVPAKEPNKWLTQDLLTSGAKGAMVGLLVGSLFGPAGLIVGPLVGGALFYGLTKLTSKD